MATSYLVDGNNVMGQRVGWHRDRAGARRRLLEQLTRFARLAGVPVAVVFDGAAGATGGENGAPEGKTAGGVGVYYAAPGGDADARIRSLVEQTGDPGALIVVTSDRQLAESVRQRGAQVVRSGELRRHLDALDALDAGAAGAPPRGGELPQGSEARHEP